MRKILNNGFVKLEGVLGSTEDTTVFQFHLKVPSFIFQEWFLHGYGEFAEAQLTEDFYIPSKFLKEDASFTETECNALFTKFENYTNWSKNFHKKLLGEGVIPYQAVLLLPMSVYITVHWTVSADDLDKFMWKTTGFEIDQYRAALKDYYKEKLPK